jgi:hypothetical protein
MFKKKKLQDVRTKTIKLLGGLNTEIASMERPPGELSVCINYHQAAGDYSGYQSMKGYERYDGQALASSIAGDTYDEYAGGPDYVLNDRVYVDTGNTPVFYCIQAAGSGSNAPDSGTPGDNTWWKYESDLADVDEYNYRKREAQRTLIAAVPGSGPIRGIHIFGNDTYAWRDNAGATAMELYKSTASGWSLVATTGMTVAGGSIRAVTSRFAKYDSNSDNMFWVDGVTEGVHVLDSSGTYSQITHTNLPSLNPINIGAWENRLFLVYETGSIFFGQVGKPDNFDSATGYAGEIDLGEPVTDIEAAAGKLLIFTRSKIKVLHYGSTTDQFIFKLDDFSDNIGAISETVQSLYETTYFGDDRGPNQLGTSAETGGFTAKNIGQKVETEYDSNKANITGSAVDIINQRYYLFYTSGSTSNGLSFTINKGKLKGIGRFQLDHKATVVTHGITTSGTPQIFFGNDAGMVFLMESGTSFDGDDILTRFITSYYHYGTPRHWKNFLRLMFEIDCGSQMPFTTGVIFDYGSPLLANSANQDQNVSGGSSTWGGDLVWGTFTWGAGVLGRGISYIHGYGSNMSVLVETETNVFSQHTIHNLTTDYEMGGIQQ